MAQNVARSDLSFPYFVITTGIDRIYVLAAFFYERDAKASKTVMQTHYLRHLEVVTREQLTQRSEELRDARLARIGDER